MSAMARALAAITSRLPTLHTQHYWDKVERQAWDDGWDAACLQMLLGDDPDDPVPTGRGLHDRDLDDALAPPAGYDPEMN